MADLAAALWPSERLGEGIEALACHARLATGARPHAPVLPAISNLDDEDLGRWLATAAGGLGVEAVPVDVPYAEVRRMVAGVGPAVLRITAKTVEGFLLVLRAKRTTVSVLAPDLSLVVLRLEEVQEALCASLEARVAVSTDAALAAARVPPQRRRKVRLALLAQRLGAVRVGGAWLLRPSPGAPFFHQLLRSRLFLTLGVFFAANLALYVLGIASWWLLGRGALRGRFDQGWFVAWILLLATTIPLRLLASRSHTWFAIGTGALLKQRFLAGALRMDPEEVRRQGVGDLLGRVFESEAVESQAMRGGFWVLVAAFQLVITAWVLSVGAGGGLLALVLGAWAALVLFLSWRLWRQQRRWTASRRNLTRELVERMVGYRTRLAQESPAKLHEGEDETLARYATTSFLFDRRRVALRVLASRGWLLVGTLAVAPSFVAGASPTALAVSLGGIMLASLALRDLAEGLTEFAGAAVAWEQSAPLFRAAALPDKVGVPAFSLGSAKGDTERLLSVADLTFRHRNRPEPLLAGVNLDIRRGDHVLLEGPSGGGKSTLISLLSGLRAPESGLVLLGGIDRDTLGDAEWRRRVAQAPQFHENHILAETLGFNLLMGRRWPPTGQDVAEAESLCRELGLGDLLQRMPGGFWQIVGDTGWQLSHGERSRIYLARALLQKAEVVILDESFAALDPGNLELALRCARRRAQTLLVVAHP